jgi:hypothetical protein
MSLEDTEAVIFPESGFQKAALLAPNPHIKGDRRLGFSSSRDQNRCLTISSPYKDIDAHLRIPPGIKTNGLVAMFVGYNLLVRVEAYRFMAAHIATFEGFLDWYPNSWMVYNGKSY